MRKPDDVKSPQPALTGNYSVITRSAHSTRDTKIVGLPNFAPAEQFSYDALNHRYRVYGNGDGQDYAFDANGRRSTIWDSDQGYQIQGQTYWGSAPTVFYSNDQDHFQHQDWVGTERARTTYNGTVEGTFSSLPYGDGLTVTGSDMDPYHFAGLDADYNGSVYHAQFREYDVAPGRWTAPDPYSGSYDFTNPQSLNRYGYVLSNPLAILDRLGLDTTVYVNGSDYSPCDDPLYSVLCFSGGSGPGGGGGGGGGGGAAPNNGAIGAGAAQYQTYQGLRLVTLFGRALQGAGKDAGKNYTCGDSPMANIRNYAFEGVTKGALAGAYESDEMIGPEATVEGAIYGGWVGGVVGTGLGALTSVACGALGVY